ncbi:MAG: hypothetical protein QOJ84_5702 [Bradyrhizobium sp.]|jgi:hypothetical protein|nr:hypothetical protein [Bradyrhizobium sp.]
MNPEPLPTVEGLLAKVLRGGTEAQEATLTLGLLIEDRPPADDAGLAVVIGPQLAELRLSPAERNAAVDGLLAYIRDTAEPSPTAIWALTKSYEPRIVPVLIALLDRHGDDPHAAPLAYQALVGIVTAGLTTPEWRERSLVAVKRAAARAHAEVAEAAQRYLKTAVPQSGCEEL